MTIKAELKLIAKRLTSLKHRLDKNDAVTKAINTATLRPERMKWQ